MRKLFLLFVFAVTVSLSAFAQQVTVKGTVISAADQEPIIGATVKGKGTDVMTATDVNGEFTLTVPAACKKLVVTYIGMYPVEVDVKPVVNIVMETNESTLNEVVVTGYGVTRKAAFTGAASVIDSEVVEKKSEVNFVKSMEGTVTGFQYNNSTSMPGQWGSVYIRGLGTLSSSSQPLYVIDGVPVNSDYDAMSSSTNNYFDPMAAYNPADIESITVLKDAAATAIYGSRAANGVIVITTKKGAEGKMSITFETRQGFTSVANNNMQLSDASTTRNFWAQGYAARTGATMTDALETIDNYIQSNYDWDKHSSYNWWDMVTRKGYYADYNLSVSGGNGKTNYYVSLNYNDANGIVIGSNNKRYGGRINIESEYKWFQVGANMSYSHSINNAFSQSTGGSNTNPTVGAFTSMNPFMRPYNEDGSYAFVTSYNPLAVWDKEVGDIASVQNTTFVGNPWFRINLPYGFWIKTNFGYNLMRQREYDYWSAVTNRQGMGYNGLGQMYISQTQLMTWTNTFGWIHSYGDNNINIMLGQEMQQENYEYDYYDKYDFPFADLGMRDLTTAAAEDGSEYYKSESRLASYFLDAHYDYDNRYFLSASYRRDGSSRFGSNKRWGNFWSVGAKWRLSQEKFMMDQNTVTTADIRASYGTVGNQGIGYYAARGFYSTGYNYMQAPGMVPTGIANPNLTWETSKKLDVGFDLSFKNRWHFTFDFYNEDTSDALYDVPLSMTTGLTSLTQNIGKIRNTGVEFGFNGTVFYTDDVSINVFANLTWNKNKVIKLATGDPIEGTYTIIEEGRPYRQFYTPEFAGIDDDGRALYYLKEEGDETTTDYTSAAKRYVGSAEPKVFGAFGINANFYGFDASIQFNYRLGSKVIDTGHAFTGFLGNALRTPLQKYVDNSWTPTNQDARWPQYLYGDPYGEVTSNYSTLWMYSGDFLRISNITFGYTLPQKITRKAFIDKVRLFVTLDNVHTWTAKDFVGFSPDTYASGVIAWQYPAVFTFTGGISVTF
ncbi:MAG: TonB-dependent receptor [Muribaculaceae bacterium]|nr:TonB-dependent receptor [Muribaculaceae bacterium]